MSQALAVPRTVAAITLLGLLCSQTASAGPIWSTSEIHLQHGSLDTPSFAGGGDADTTIVTLQNASGWEKIELFVFLDIIDDNRSDGFNDSDLYGELYVGGGFGKLSGKDLSFGPFKDIGWVFGINHADDAKVWKYLPGLRLYWNAPGFAFLNTDITAYIDDSRGVGRGGAPKESDSFMVDFAWAYPFSVGEQKFSIEGHMEYIDGRRNEFGGEVASWILAQPQFRWDIGHALGWGESHLFLGIEYQYWRNKLGDPNTDESALQALVVLQL
ncbi:outer membrane protein OmpK [Pseudomarimonas arenosa]|uniref:Nucleoside-binding protein n=1 Tax=Pseudomarimonas arenosa TaxID=2774145 RepID=A0AAW3ZMY0_9GAMM|nr:outer membrane protein OmpK [Pseudomarimonas arenosa]MBD8526850.1 nucleoside-binding protein [Pseudomarimonas arenosa]